jgi:DNA repair ATPase RecN
MPTYKATEPEVDKSLETDMERNVHELKRASAATFNEIDNGNAKMAANDLAALLGRVSEVSTREIENLIDELRGLREKLRADCDRISDDVTEYAELSQGVTRLTANISDSANILTSAPDTGRIPHTPRSGG